MEADLYNGHKKAVVVYTTGQPVSWHLEDFIRSCISLLKAMSTFRKDARVPINSLHTMGIHI